MFWLQVAEANKWKINLQTALNNTISGFHNEKSKNGVAFSVHWLCDSVMSLGTQALSISPFCQLQYKLCSKDECSGDQNIIVSSSWSYASPCSSLVWKREHIFLWFSLVAGISRRSQNKSSRIVLTWPESCAHFGASPCLKGSIVLRPSAYLRVGSPGSTLWDGLCAGGLLESTC